MKLHGDSATEVLPVDRNARADVAAGWSKARNARLAGCGTPVEYNAATSAVVTIDGNAVNGAGSGVEGDLAGDRAVRVVVAGNHGESANCAPRVNRQQRVEAAAGSVEGPNP